MFLGYIEDVEEILAHAKVLIVPTRIAAGLPYKITLAAKCGLPVVMSKILAQQISPIEFFKLSSSVEEFVDNTIQICINKSEWTKYSNMSLDYATQLLDINKFSSAFEIFNKENYQENEKN